MAAKKQYWLMKTEPSNYSIDDLERDGVTHWEGVRNYQARNIMRDDIKEGDEVLIYHSGIRNPHVAGRAGVVREAYPDHFACDPDSPYFDNRATQENPIWLIIDIKFSEKFVSPVFLDQIKSHPDLHGIMVARRGMRLSIQPVEKHHFNLITKLGRKGSSQ